MIVLNCRDMPFDDLGQRTGQPIVRDASYLGRVLDFSETQIMMRLKAHPECCRNARQPFKADSHARGDGGGPGQDAMKRLPRDAEIDRRLFHGQTKSRQHVAP
jgi:hypothetical protein